MGHLESSMGPARLFLLATTLFAASAVLAPRAAEALRAAPTIDLLQPADGAVDVPLDARIWVGNEIRGARDELVVLDEDDRSVVVTESVLRGWGGVVQVLTPVRLFEPGSTYALMAGGEVLSTFTTGFHLSESAPLAPRLTLVETHVDSSLQIHVYNDGARCHFARFHVEACQDALLFVVDEGGRTEIDPDLPAGHATDLTTDGTVSIGSWGCFRATWREAGPGAETEVSAGAFDLAGNFSGFGPPEPVRLPDAPLGCVGCAAGSGGGRHSLAAALLLLVVLATGRPRPRG